MSSNSSKRIETTKHLKDVPLSEMKVSPAAQREFRPHWCDYLVANFDMDKMGVPTVSYREGSYFVVDGQHTTEALRRLGFGDAKVQCWYYSGLTEADEAELFLVLNNRLTVNPFDRFGAGVTAGRPVPSDINRIVRAAGLNVSKSKGEGSIGAVGTLERVYTRGGPKTLARTVKIIRDSFGDPGFSAAVIDGIGLVCQRYNGELDDAALIGKLGGVHAGASGLLGKANVLRKQYQQPLNQCVAAAAVDIHNSGKGGKKLPSWWKS